MVDSITGADRVGDTFRASLDAPIVVGTDVVAPKYSEIYVRLVDEESAGKFSGKSELHVRLDRIVIAKQSYPVVSDRYSLAGRSEGVKAARNIGVGAAVGAVIGGVIGGGKGAAIGAGAGVGGGAIVTKPDVLRIESESKLVFRLEGPLTVELPSKGDRVGKERQ